VEGLPPQIGPESVSSIWEATMELKELEGQVVIVTGASRGIGEAIALAFAARGCPVTLAARDERRLEQVAGQIKALGGRCLVCATDVTSAVQVQRMVDQTVEAFGRLDILVNNAGILILKKVIDTTMEDWQSTLDTNLTAVFLAAKAALPTMIRQKYGQIITVASIAGKRSGPRHGAYSAAKFGVLGLTEALASEVKEYNIRVNAVNPGMVDTDLFGDEFRGDRSDWSQPQDIADAVLLLASDLAHDITGISLDVLGTRP
jgi:NAD(P)-dependent dehydrogenase (short-subunit alcohol dehydrogenase family)